MESSYIGSQYSVLRIPSLYRLTKTDSRCIETTAADSSAMGWESRAIARSVSNT